ncbi:MAG: GDYXXLXY domain-containing protein [Usitatibacteraceae bacterium]
MSATITRVLIALGAVLVLGGVNYSIWQKERIKRDGDIVFIDLAPVDPRSLIQGDYMTLNFRLAQEIESSLPAMRDPASAASRTNAHARPRNGEMGLAPITLDAKRIAKFSGSVGAGGANTRNVRYRIRNDRVWLGTNAFFFEEGRAEQYAKARYGEFRLDAASGEIVLVGLRDNELKPL